MTSSPVTDAFTCVFGSVRGARGAEYDLVKGINSARASALMDSLEGQLGDYYYDDTLDIINDAGIYTQNIQHLKEALVKSKLKSFSKREPHILHDMWDAARLCCRPFTKVLVQNLDDGSKKLHLHDYYTQSKVNPKDRMLCGYIIPHAAMPSAPRGQWLHPFADTTRCVGCAGHQQATEWKECLDTEDYPVSHRLRVITPVFDKACIQLTKDLFPETGRKRALSKADLEGMGNWAWRGAVASELVHHVTTNPKQCDEIFERWTDDETYARLCNLYPGVIERTAIIGRGDWGMIYHTMARSKYLANGTMPKHWKAKSQAHLKMRIGQYIDKAIASQ